MPVKFGFPTDGITFPVLQNLILHSDVTDASHEPSYFFVLPLSFVANFAFSRKSSPDSVHLQVMMSSFFLGGEPYGINWPDIAFLVSQPVFQQPIHIHIAKARLPLKTFFERKPDIERLLTDKKITITVAEEQRS